MAADDPLIDALAGAILDGDSIDWATAESDAGDEARPLLGHLRVLAAIAQVHRSDPSSLAGLDDPGATVRTGPETGAIEASGVPPIASWGTLTLLAKLGEGSFAEVYRAWDARLEREVALKLLRRAESGPGGAASTVIEEGRLLARVRHPNVVVVHGADRLDGRVGLWMELVHGRTLERVLRDQGPFGVQEATVIGLDICRALSAVHRAGLLHRDVKAQNVVREQGGRIVLMDFGTGLTLAEGDETARRLAGTPLYLAPEVLAGQPASHRSDIYSLGVLLYHLVTGSFPVEGGSLREVRERHARGERTRLRDARPDLPERFIGAVERALAPLPGDRYESAGAMEAALLAVVGATHPASSSRDSDNRARGARRWRRREGVLAAVFVLGLAAAAGLGFLLARRAAPPSPLPRIQQVQRLTELSGIEETPALSPDGKSVAFTAYRRGNRQVFVRLIAGGPPLQVTQDPVDHQQPRWSPDSSALVYFSPPESGELLGTLREVSALGGPSRPIVRCLGGGDVSLADGRIACVRLDGGRLQLVTLSRDGSEGSALHEVTELVAGNYYLYPRWSPDGRWIAFQRGDGVRFDVFAVPAVGGEPRRLTHDQTLLNGFAWLPDSSGIVFSSSRASTLPYLPDFGLWEIRFGEPEPRPLTSGDSSFVHPDLDRTGTLVASRMRVHLDLWKLPVDGQPRQNVLDAARLTQQTGYVQTPTAGPGDHEVAFLSDSGGHTNLWVLDTQGGELRQITNEREPGVAVGVPIWSPDGSSIAYVTTRGNAGLWFGLWLVDPDGRDPRRLVQHGLGAAWSSDGRWLYFVEGPDQVLKKIPAAGGVPVLVRRDRIRNVIGAHGSTLYYTVERPLVDGRPEFEIRAATPETGPSRLVARIPAARVASWQIVNPALSPDGEWLVQPLTDEVTTNLWALSTTTGAWRQLTDFGDRPTFIARRVSWSSDGHAVFAAVGEGDADIVLLDGLVSPAREGS